jgi:hypothetical protein
MKKEIQHWFLDGPHWIQYAVKKQILKKNIDPVLATCNSEIKALVSTLNSDIAGFKTILTGNILKVNNHGK